MLGSNHLLWSAWVEGRKEGFLWLSHVWSLWLLLPHAVNRDSVQERPEEGFLWLLHGFYGYYITVTTYGFLRSPKFVTRGREIKIGILSKVSLSTLHI